MNRLNAMEDRWTHIEEPSQSFIDECNMYSRIKIAIRCYQTVMNYKYSSVQFWNGYRGMPEWISEHMPKSTS